MAVGRQEMDALSTGLCFMYEGFQPRHGCAFRDSRLRGQAGHAVHRTEPDDVFDVNVVSNQVFLVVVHVNDTGKPFPVQSVEVQETAVLAVGIGVGRVIGRCTVVAEEQNQPALDLVLELVASGNIDVFVE